MWSLSDMDQFDMNLQIGRVSTNLATNFAFQYWPFHVSFHVIAER
jgi:hypothetical protein